MAQCQINAMGTPVKQFFCPSRRAPMALSGGSWYGPGGTYNHALCDYAASNLDQTGAMAYGYVGHRLQDIISGNGTASTLLIGEKRLNLYYLGQFQSDDNEGYTLRRWRTTTSSATPASSPPPTSAARAPGPTAATTSAARTPASSSSCSVTARCTASTTAST